MIRINIALKTTALLALVALTPGCAGLGSLEHPTPESIKAPHYTWGDTVDFGGIHFQFNTAKTQHSFTNWVGQPTVAGEQFVIIDVYMTNKTGAPLPTEFQPIFRLIDSTGAIYDADVQKTIMINLGKPGRMVAGQSMNPNSWLQQEIVFDVPKNIYSVEVLTPDRARASFAGNITAIGPFFIYDLGHQLDP
ncbi:MAG: DUF4352 domain-containing protein [Lysobacteraceae bacterium]